MCNYILKGLISNFKNYDMSAFEPIYNEFKRLISLYSSRVGGEDTVQELTIFLIELLFSIDTNKFQNDNTDGLSRYIAVSIRNRYIALSKQYKKHNQTFTKMCESELIFNDFFEQDLTVFEALKSLPPRQKHIMMYKYIYNYSDIEIANMLKISRQAVNKLKNRALAHLRDYYF